MPGPLVHPGFAALVAFPVPDEDGPARGVEVRLLEGEGLADAQPGSPEHDDERTEPSGRGAASRRAHGGDYLFDARRIGWVATSLVSGRASFEEAGDRGGGGGGGRRGGHGGSLSAPPQPRGP